MYRTLLRNKQGELLAHIDYDTFEESLKGLNLQINEYPVGLIKEAYIYKRRDPNISSSGIMIASLRTIR